MPSTSAVLTFIAWLPLSRRRPPPLARPIPSTPRRLRRRAPCSSRSADRAEFPCQAVVAGRTYGVFEVVDLALCQNPRTREAWANARVQAALVGGAEAQFLPSLDGSVASSACAAMAGTPV